MAIIIRFFKKPFFIASIAIPKKNAVGIKLSNHTAFPSFIFKKRKKMLIINHILMN